MCVQNVSNEKMLDKNIDDLLNSGYKLSTGKCDTYYMVGSDNTILMTVTRVKHGVLPFKYSVDLLQTDQFKKIDQGAKGVSCIV